MKTFEERYTEWIDGELRGAALIAFEEELSRRAQAGEAQAEKVGAQGLRALLREHLQAPALSNTEFFNHQLRERIEREGGGQRRVAPERRAAVAPASWWSFVRFALPGAVALFVGAALYYGMIPKAAERSASAVAVNAPKAMPAPAAVEPPAPAPISATPAGGPVEMALLDVAPATVDLQAHALDESTSATPLQFKAPNRDQTVQVLWMNGLEYQPDAPAATPAP